MGLNKINIQGIYIFIFLNHKHIIQDKTDGSQFKRETKHEMYRVIK